MGRFRNARRAVSSVALVALAAAAVLVVGAPTSNAAGSIGGTLTAASQPTIYTNTSGQAAGNLVLSNANSFNVNDTFVITVDDNDAAVNCAAAGDTVGFSGTPVVTVSAVTPSGAATPHITAGYSASTLACTNRSTNDELTLTVTTSSAATSATITVSNIKYDVGVSAATGAVKVNGNTTTASNATVSNLKVSANTPPSFVQSSATGVSISNITLTETSPGVISQGPVCVFLTPGPTRFTSGSQPTASATGGGASVSPILPAPFTLTFFVQTASSGAPATYVISGIQLEGAMSSTGAGQVAVSIGTGCGDSSYASGLVIAFDGVVGRIAGGTRFGTAEAIADSTSPCWAAKPVLIARGDDFADALSASYLAGKENTQILLTSQDSVPNETLNALRQHGATTVQLIGGPGAIFQSVQDQLNATPATDCTGKALSPAQTISTSRIFGADRFETAKTVAEFPGLGAAGTAEAGLDASGSSPCGAQLKTAVLALGTNFPDALAAGPVGYAGLFGSCNPGGGGPLPLLLTNPAPAGPNSFAMQAMTDLGIQQVIIMGGTGAISSFVDAALNTAGIQVVRMAGTTRQGTAAAMALIEGSSFVGGFNSGAVLISRPDTFPDALAASVIATKTPLLLADSTSALGAISTNAIVGYPLGLFTKATALGGTGALEAAVLSQLGSALASQPS